jgi:hypothetical protein
MHFFYLCSALSDCDFSDLVRFGFKGFCMSMADETVPYCWPVFTPTLLTLIQKIYHNIAFLIRHMPTKETLLSKNSKCDTLENRRRNASIVTQVEYFPPFVKGIGLLRFYAAIWLHKQPHIANYKKTKVCQP